MTGEEVPADQLDVVASKSKRQRTGQAEGGDGEGGQADNLSWLDDAVSGNGAPAAGDGEGAAAARDGEGAAAASDASDEPMVYPVVFITGADIASTGVIEIK